MSADSLKNRLSWKQTPCIVARRIRGEVLLVPIHSNSENLDSFFTLNPTAAEIWQAICEGWHLAEIAESLSDQYAVSVEEAEADILRLAAELEILGALERNQPKD